jgi:predicted ATPase/DNA-binding SARP family transcriptional activator
MPSLPRGHSPVWRIELLGQLRALRGEQVITRFRRRKTGVLLAYLVCSIQRPHPREELIELLWPECDPAAGRDRLSTELSSLRRQLEPPGVPAHAVLIADRGVVGINPAAVVTDVAQFEARIAAAARARSSLERAQCLTEAVAEYRGELLPGYFEDWVLSERQRLAGMYLQALGQLSRQREEEGDLPGALDYARRLLASDALREEAHHELIRLLAASGQPAAALRQYHELERLLDEELGAPPSAATQALVQEIHRRQQAKSAPSASGSPPTTPPEPGPSGKPAAPTRSAGTRPPSLSGERRAGPESAAPVPEPSSARRLIAPPTVLPTGIITFVLADLTPLADSAAGGAMSQDEELRTQAERLRKEYARHRGHVVRDTDGVLVAVFGRASDALAAAVASSQIPGTGNERADPGPDQPRIAVHTGEAEPTGGQYPGASLDHAVRLLRAAHPGQVLVSEPTAALVRAEAEPGRLGPRLTDLGLYRLREAAEGGETPERLFQATAPEMAPLEFPPPHAAPFRRGQLPLQLNRFFGRQAEIAALRERLLDPQTRLVTLTGSGGSGKTRLALAVAEELVEEFYGAVWFVPLAELTEANQIPDAIRNALGLPRRPGEEPLEQVTAALSRRSSPFGGGPSGREGPRAALLLLDNFEHLARPGADIVQRLLEQVSELACLVTSRLPLGLVGEREFAVGPLPVPGVGSWELGVRTEPAGPNTQRPTPNSLLSIPSVQLFVDRAQSVRADFQITAANAPAVGALCQRLEGIPLALELAAGRAQVLTPAQMLTHLEQRLNFLVSRQQRFAPRHRTLRATLDWSYQLLAPEVRQFFARLSVFRGGWTLEAAENVCSEPFALDHLETLRESSLVVAEDLGGVSEGAPESVIPEMRYRLLETLREYGWEQLSPEEREMQARQHARYLLGLAERAEADQVGSAPARWLARLEREHDNLRAALDWCQSDGGDTDVGLTLATALGWFWQVRGYLTEGRDRLRSLLEADARSGRMDVARVRARALETAARFARLLGDVDALQRLAAEALALGRALGDPQIIAPVLMHLAADAHRSGDRDAAYSLLEECLAIYRELADRRGLAQTLTNLALHYHHRDFARARALLQEGKALFLELGDESGVAWAVAHDGNLAYYQGRCHETRCLAEECMVLFRQQGDRMGIAFALHQLGMVALAEGDPGAAHAHHEEALRIAQELNNRRDILASLLNLARADEAQGRWRAARTALEEALVIARDLDDSVGVALSLHRLGRVTLQEGKSEQAGALFRHSLALAQAQDHRLCTVNSLEGLAEVARLREALERAARLFGAAAALRTGLAIPRPPHEQPAYEGQVTDLRQAMGEAAFAAAWEAGRALTREAAVALALEDHPTP